jgi:hypothetical protein
MMNFDQWKRKLIRLADKQTYIVPGDNWLYRQYELGRQPEQSWCIILAKLELKKSGIDKVCLDKLPAIVSDVQATVDALVLDTLYWESKV